jgi:predicted nucleic acid-binding protein
LTLVLDASMAIAWMFDDERTDGTAGALRRVVAEGAVVPSLWRLEVANVLRNAIRRGRCDELYADRSLDRLRRYPITVDDETNDHAWGAMRVLARERGLTVYDAAYLELAIRGGLPLATCDRVLIAAAGVSGVETLAA